MFWKIRYQFNYSKQTLAMAILVHLIFISSTGAAITVYENESKFVNISGNLQLQYHVLEPADGSNTDELFFRRIQPGIEASIYEHWIGKIVWEMGKAKNGSEIELKDVYVQYKGFKYANITLGNFNIPFSREQLTSNKNQHIVERTFVGDHNYGTPGRNIGLGIHGQVFEKKLEYMVAFAKAAIDPDARKLDFESPINFEDDFNEGWICAVRADFHPFGYLKKSQGDFERELKGTLSLAAFIWNNDNDNNTYTGNGMDISGAEKPDVDSVTGMEISAAMRGFGVSVDAQYNLFNAQTVDNTISQGIYQNGDTHLPNISLEGGIMILPGMLEIAAGFEAQDASGYSKKWTRTTVGTNFFFKDHDIKVQGAYRMGKNLDGAYKKDADEIFIQFQYAF